MSSKLRVLFIGHTYTVGLNQQKLDALAHTGEVTVALLAPRSWHERDWGHTVHFKHAYPSFRAFSSRILFNSHPGAFLYNPAALSRAIADFRPHLLQVEQEVFSLSAFELSLLARAYRLPVVHFGWENLDRSLAPPRRLTRSFVLRHACGIVSGNRENQSLLTRWGYSGPTLVLPQLGVDPALFHPRPHVNGTGEFTIGYLGRFLRQKGIDLLLDAAALLRRRGLPVRVHLCGSGPAEPELRARTARLNLDAHITWQRTVPHHEIPGVLAHFDILALPSRTIPTWKEQFGHVLIEAMAMSIPVVGSTCGEIPHVIGSDDLVFPENDSAAFAAILSRLLANPAARADVGRFGLERVRDHYTHDRIATRLLSFYDEILQRSS